ncbi:MAG: DNA topoisomerase I, partial [Salinarimonadaceae bacterium]
EDEESRRLPPMKANDPLERRRIEAMQHFTEPPPRYSEASLVKRMEELGIGRPSTYASVLQVLKDREYVRIEKKRLVAEDKGRIVTAFLEAFFKRYVEYDFTADLEAQLDRISNNEIDWKQVLRDFWKDFSAAIGETKDLRTTQVLDALNDYLGPYIFPPRENGGNPRACPSCADGILSLKIGRYGSFIGCSNYPECRFTRQLSVSGDGDGAGADGSQPGVRILGQDPVSGLDVTVRDGRFGPFIQLGEAQEGGEKPKRSSLPKGLSPSDVDLERALALLSLPREVARHPETGEPILAGIGRFGPYVQHGRVYANIGRDDDILEIGANRAIDLIVAKESGVGGRRGGDPGREIGKDPESGKAIVVKAGRYGPYVTDGKTNATLPKGLEAEALELDKAVELLRAKQASGAGKKKGGKAAAASAAGSAKKASPKKPAARKTAAKKASANTAAGKTATAKKPAAKKAAEKSAPSAAS